MVVHIYPEDCPMCGISNADPVIISRSMALLIVSKYCRVQCGCGWKLCNEKINDGWETPETQSEDDDDVFDTMRDKRCKITMNASFYLFSAH